MTQKEMTEIFGIMLLAYPNAETFKGGIQKLLPTINLWCACLPEVDFWIGQQAVIKLCRECKYPPTIAEFREKADAVKSEIRQKIKTDWDQLRMAIKLSKMLPEEAVERIGGTAKLAVAAMGGADKLIIQEEHEFGDGRRETVEVFDFNSFRAAYEKVLRKQAALPGAGRPAIGAGTKQIGGNTL